MTHAITIQALADHGTFVRRLAHSLLRDANAAEDLMQDTWLSLLRRPPRAADSAKSWLASVVMNRARKHHRGTKHRAEREAAAAQTEIVAPASASAERLELQQQVVAAVLALPEHYRQVVLLTFYEGMSAAEAARHLGVPAGTVRSQLSRGLAELRTKLDRSYPGGRAAWSLALLRLVDHTGATLSVAKSTLLLTVLGGIGAAAWLATDTPAGADASATLQSHASAPQPTAIASVLPEIAREAIAEPVAATEAEAAQDQEPDYTKLSLAELQQTALWMQHYLRTRLLVPEPDEIGAELAQLRGIADVGSTRILVAEPFEYAANEPLGVRCGGSYFSFVTKSHSFDDQPDLGLHESGFRGGAGDTFILDLGDAALATLNAVPPGNLSEGDRQAYAHLWTPACDARGNISPEFKQRGQALRLTSDAAALPGHTYVTRSIPSNSHDILVAFRSVGSDATGHTIVYRILHRFGQFAEIRNRMPKPPTGKAPGWIAAMSGADLLAALGRLRTVAEARLLAVPEPLAQTHSAALASDTVGLCRILPRARFAALIKTRGEGAYYDFLARSHDYNARPDLYLEQGSFSAAGRGLVVDLGEAPLATAEIPERHEDVWTRDAVTTLTTAPAARDEHGRFRFRDADYQAYWRSGYTSPRAKPNHTYLLRSVTGQEDLLIAFQVLASDADGATLLWRLIRRR